MIKDFLLFVAELILGVLILYTVFSPNGIGTSIIDYIAYAEPIFLQEYISTYLTTAAYSSGDFFINLKVSGVAHKLSISSENDNHYIQIIPASGKVLYETPEKMPFLAGDCTISDKVIILGEGGLKNLIIRKTSNPCNIEVSLT